MGTQLQGLVAAPHTPFDNSGSLNLGAIERQVQHLLQHGVRQVFVCGTTGESASLSVAEREQVAARWLAIAKGTPLQVIVHVGSNCVMDARHLAAHAELNEAQAIAALAPSYFKPNSLSVLVECMQSIAHCAPGIPFYYYEIPALTGIGLPAVAFLEEAANRIPTLAGIKFTNPDLMAYQLCLHANEGRWDVAWGCDEYVLAALALGGRSAVGSSYNFAAPIYQRLWKAFDEGDLQTARHEQFCSVRLIQILCKYGYMAASKAMMGMLDVPVGPPRLPQQRLSPDQYQQLQIELDSIEVWSWLH